MADYKLEIPLSKLSSSALIGLDWVGNSNTCYWRHSCIHWLKHQVMVTANISTLTCAQWNSLLYWWLGMCHCNGSFSKWILATSEVHKFCQYLFTRSCTLQLYIDESTQKKNFPYSHNEYNNTTLQNTFKHTNSITIPGLFQF